MKSIKLSWKNFLFAVIAVAGLTFSTQASAAEKEQSVMCLKTNTGNYYPVIRVAFMVAADGGDTFEIVLRDGQGEAGVKSVSFEKNRQKIDLDKYKRASSTSGYPSPDFTKKIYLITNTGKYFTFTSLPTLKPQAGTDKYDVEIGNTTEKGVSAIWFYRGDEQGATDIDAPIAQDEALELMTPVSQQMQISGCGNAKKAMVFATDGKKVAEASVLDGTATVQVGNLTSGVYIVKVGNKSLKFLKK